MIRTLINTFACIINSSVEEFVVRLRRIIICNHQFLLIHKQFQLESGL